MRTTRFSFLLSLAGLAGYTAVAEVNPAVPSQTVITPGQVNTPAPAATGTTPSAAVTGNNLILTLANAPFEDNSGQAQGRLNYLVVNPNGQIDLAVLSMGTRLVPVPWQFVTPAPNVLVNQPQSQTGARPLFRVVLDQQQLQQAPALQQNGLSQLIQTDASQQLLGFYGLSANANTAMGSAGRVGTGSITGAGNSALNNPLGVLPSRNANTNAAAGTANTTTSPFVTPFPNTSQQVTNSGQDANSGNQTVFPNTAFPISTNQIFSDQPGNQTTTGQNTPGTGLNTTPQNSGQTTSDGLALPGQPTPPPALPLAPPPDPAISPPTTPQSPSVSPPAGGTGGTSGGAVSGSGTR